MKTNLTTSPGFIRSFLRARRTAAGLLCTGLLACPAVLFSEIPRGVFAVADVDGNPVGRTLENDDVDGISLRYQWSTIEPEEGEYNFEALDAAVAECVTYGKEVLIRIGTQQSRPEWVTEAVRDAGGKFFTFLDQGVPTEIPVFWDKTFVAKKTAMIERLGLQYAGNPWVKIISVSFANATSEDWNVPNTAQDIANWYLLGYTTRKMVKTGATMINTTMEAFPSQCVTLAVGGNGTLDLPRAEDYVARAAIRNARAQYGERMIAQRNNLSTSIPEAPGTGTLYRMIWDFQPEVAGQMVNLCLGSEACGAGYTPEEALTISVEKALDYGEKYVEIYQSDVNHFPDVIAWAHDALNPP